MRARLIVQILSFAVIVAVGAIWIKSRTAAAGLQARIAALTDRRQATRVWEQERDRLRSALAEATRRQQTDAPATSPGAVEPAPPSVGTAAWPLGEWRTSREWRNEGRSTVRGTVGTLLWAAAGGDVATTMQIIAFDEAGRKQAQELFDSLPPDARQAFPTPEALVAGLTIQAVPNNAAQLSWFHQRDADHATVGLLLGAPDQSAPTEALAVPPKDNNPVMLVDSHATKLTVLSLQRSANGWRVVIPAEAIKRLAPPSKPPTT